MSPSLRPTPLLDKVNWPRDLRMLAPDQLPQLADELRTFVIDTVAKTGGHFASGLGAVELTVALHYVFDTPNDLLVWDVGHQAYPHKVLTGRRDRLKTIRQAGGLSGFPNRSETEYDVFGAAHASTAISAALGMAIARRPPRRKKGSRRDHRRRRPDRRRRDGGPEPGRLSQEPAARDPERQRHVDLAERRCHVGLPPRIARGQIYQRVRERRRAHPEEAPGRPEARGPRAKRSRTASRRRSCPERSSRSWASGTWGRSTATTFPSSCARSRRRSRSKGPSSSTSAP